MSEPSSQALPRIFVAIDRMQREEAAADLARLGSEGYAVKLGLEFFVANGPDGVRAVAGARPLFLDLKLHDIPNTVAGGVRAAALCRPRFLTIHASGGRAMMEAARDAASSAGPARPLLLAITVLTSLDDSDLDAVGQRGPAGDQALRLAVLAKAAGMDGVVCSAHEIARLRREVGPEFKLVVPGIRPEWAATGDQKRVMTPREAVARGADHLVIGRPITQAAEPKAALARVLAEIAA
ncbi:MAG: orotidine-5'-phosphate decarboxylase [Alphaproteobacteria bacterium]|nr:orotidine-5'-phosphate decarboxylase [Alphaproteobacteria bacterium]